jgi:cell shape-determining protein MreC
MSEQNEILKLIQELQKSIEELKKENKELKETLELEKEKTPKSITETIQKKLQETQELSDDLERKINIAIDTILKYAKAVGF